MIDLIDEDHYEDEVDLMIESLPAKSQFGDALDDMFDENLKEKKL